MDEILRKSDILSTDEKISILRDAVDFLPATYINEKHKCEVMDFINELLDCKNELDNIKELKYEE